MIRLSAQDGLRAIELFHCEEPNHLMAEGQRTQGEFFGRFGLDFRGEPVGAAYNEGKVPNAAVVPVFNPFGQFRASRLLSPFVEEHHMVDVLQRFEENGSFRCLELFMGDAGVSNFHIGKFHIAEWGVAGEAVDVPVDAFTQPRCGGLADDDERNSHVRRSVELTCRR